MACPSPLTLKMSGSSPRHFVVPESAYTTGYPRVQQICRQIGVEHDDWQVELNRALLAKAPDGLYASDTAVISVPRQAGKTFDIGTVMFAECIANPGTTVVWTAHRFKVARETFNELRGLAKSPKLVPHIDYDKITTAAGNEAIPFRNDSRIVFAARERGAIRGFTKVRYLILDEAQILSHAQLADLAPTMNQAVNPLIILMGTPPKPTDPAEVFKDARDTALTSGGIFYVEYSADATGNPDDRDQWRLANPSFPDRTPAKALLRLKRLLSRDDFKREVLGVWDDDAAYTVIPLSAWQAMLAESEPDYTGSAMLAVHTTHDRSMSTVAMCAADADGIPVGSVLRRDKGTEWTVKYILEQLKVRPNYGVCIDSGGPASTLIDELRLKGVDVHAMSTSEAKRAFGDFFDRCTNTGDFRHLGQAELTAAMRLVQDRHVGDGRMWDAKHELSDIAVAVTNSHWGWLSRSRVGLQIY